MPTYDYQCARCGHAFELFHGPDEKPRRTCPKCRARKVQRLIGTGAAVIFKGSGFYHTDYRSESYKSAARKEQGDGSSGKKDSADQKDSAGKKGSSSSKDTPAGGCSTGTGSSKGPG